MKNKSHWYDGLPKSLRIGPYDIGLQLREFDDLDTWGCWAFGALAIQLSPNQPSKSFAVDTLIHELFHALWKIYGLAQQDSDERYATVMATAWTQLYKDNPRLLSWIASALK